VVRPDFETVRDLFTRALELPAAGQRAFLESACADEAVRADVLSLLAQAGETRGALDAPLPIGELTQASFVAAVGREGDARHEFPDDPLRNGLAGRPAGDGDDAPPPGGRIGEFLLGERLGIGGMGVVFRAVQDFTQREVALKLLRLPLHGGSSPARLQREAEVLGRLAHPGIARVLQTGLAPDGRPWIAMELVHGSPLVDAANQLGLDVPARVELLARVCDIVQHAHAHGVVHRDLKPDNVLVDAQGHPHVLDFGIARLPGADAQLTRRTQAGQIIGTLAYMSPEQASGEGGDVDGRADVYALGVLLYELLSGRLPFPTRGLTLSQAVRAVLEDEPAPLGTLPPRHARELAIIVGVALARRREDRYASAAALAEDLRRCLAGVPIVARPPSALARARAFARRNKAFCVSSASVLLALVTGFAVATAQWNATLAAERKASEEVDHYTQLVDVGALREVTERIRAQWPVEPGQQEGLRRLIGDAEVLAGHRAQHERTLAELLKLDVSGSAGAAPRFPRNKTRWMHRMTTEFLAGLATLTAPEPYGDSIAGLKRRLQYGTTVEAATLEDREHPWDAAIAAIAASPHYGGLVLTPQLGLLPLGPDPVSGLWEFALWDWTGRVPERDPHTGALRLDADTALVLVLLPGGRATLGAQHDAPTAARFDPEASANESPLREVELDPFFLSKDELTFGQYRTFTGREPSSPLIRSQLREEFGSGDEWLRHPVHALGWDEATATLAQLGLELPTEAQWEYAARAGSETPRWTGLDDSAFGEAVNVADRARWQRFRGGSSQGAAGWSGSDDGWSVTAPADWGRANAFGLRGVLGNIDELCRDIYLSSWRGELRAGDGLQLLPESEEDEGRRSVRGGSFAESARCARASFRVDTLRDDATHGVRPARALAGWSRRGAQPSEAGAPGLSATPEEGAR